MLIEGRKKTSIGIVQKLTSLLFKAIKSGKKEKYKIIHYIQ